MSFEIKGLKEAISQFRGTEKKLQEGMKLTMDASLLLLHDEIPRYPKASETSSYRRTGSLGRSLGASKGGRKIGKADINIVAGRGVHTQGRFGTRLSYAPYVISDDKQAYMHKGRWWTMQTILDRAHGKLVKAWKMFVEWAVNYQG